MYQSRTCSRSRVAELRREHGVEVHLRVAADGRVARIQRDVLEVVEAGEQADLGELAHAGDEAELDVRVAVLDDRVESAEEVAVGAGDLRRVQCVENRLVVLVDQDDGSLPGPRARHPDEMAETLCGRVVAGTDAELFLEVIQLGHQVDV